MTFRRYVDGIVTCRFNLSRSTFHRNYMFIALATSVRLLSARGLDSTDPAQRGPYKKDRGPIFSQYGPEQAWLTRDLLLD